MMGISKGFLDGGFMGPDLIYLSNVAGKSALHKWGVDGKSSINGGFSIVRG